MDFARHVAIGAGSKDKGWNYPDQRKERLKEGIEQSIKLEHGRLAKISTKANDDVFDYYMKKVTIWDFIKMKFGWKKMIEPHFEMVVHCHGLKDIDK